MNYKSVFLGLSFILLFSLAKGQNQKGSLEVVKDPMIDRLQESRIIFKTTPIENESEEKKGKKGTALGFRIQIYSGPNRNEAYAAQSRFQRQYSDVSTYVSYTQPNYRVKVGDFRSRSEAQAFMREVKNSFPTLFLFTEQVNVYY